MASSCPAPQTHPFASASPLSSETCTVCFESFGKEETVLLECGHSFHGDCGKTWFDFCVAVDCVCLLSFAHITHHTAHIAHTHTHSPQPTQPTQHTHTHTHTQHTHTQHTTHTHTHNTTHTTQHTHTTQNNTQHTTHTHTHTLHNTALHNLRRKRSDLRRIWAAEISRAVVHTWELLWALSKTSCKQRLWI